MKILFATKTNLHLQNVLHEAGHQCDINIMKDSIELNKVIGYYDGVVINSRFVIDRKIIDRATNLKFIARVGAGMESIDVKYLEEKGILCFNSPEGNRQSVGEHTLGLLLNLLHRQSLSDRQIRDGNWLRLENKGMELDGKTVAIIGYGNMGSAFARCLAGFKIKVIAYDKYKTGYTDRFVREKTLKQVFNEADIVSMHVPLTDETRYMVNEVFLHSFKKNIFLLNTARGKILNTEDLVSKLKSGKVLGAGLDVLEYESLSFEGLAIFDYPEPLQYLIFAENVILTPHIAGLTVEADLKHAKVLADKILSAFK